MSARILNAALGYAGLGVTVFPMASAVKKSLKSAKFSNGSPWGATRGPEEVRRDFTKWDGCRIGVPTGAINRIVVIETDTESGHGVDGAAALVGLEAKHGALPDTRHAISPSGSIHRYFRHPGDGIKIRTTASELGVGIDVRGDGGCILAPPSVNPDGRRYRWLNQLPLAPMPAWLIELTREKPLTISQRAIAAIKQPLGHGHLNRSSASNAYAAAALEYEISALASAAPGGRNHALNRASFSLHQLVAGGELDGGEVDRQLLEAATANGLVGDDGIKAVMATIKSGRDAGLANPRSRPCR
jgi:putative DNA primase/helicase